MKVVYCDDHPMSRLAMRSVLEDSFPDLQLLEASCAMQLLEIVDAHPDLQLVLVDHGLPDQSGEELLPILRKCCKVPIVIVSASEDPQLMQRVVALGAAGFLPKSSSIEILRKSISLILAGGKYLPAQAMVLPPPSRLTQRQREIADLLAQGMSNQQICALLGISENTAKTHLRQIFKSLNVCNRTEAALVWLHESAGK